MIASVHGTVQAVRLDAAVVEVGGVGLLVQATPATLAGLRVGPSARLATSLVVREDSLTLFGFADADEREVFEIVQTVSGVGPRLALAMLAVHTPDGLRRAVARRGPQGARNASPASASRAHSASSSSSRTASASRGRRRRRRLRRPPRRDGATRSSTRSSASAGRPGPPRTPSRPCSTGPTARSPRTRSPACCVRRCGPGRRPWLTTTSSSPSGSRRSRWSDRPRTTSSAPPRPRCARATWTEFVGQRVVRDQLSLVLQAARARGRAPDHVLLSGPPGLGKTTLGDDHRRRARRLVARDERPGDPARGRPGGRPVLARGGRGPVHRRDPPAGPPGRGAALRRDGGLPGRRHRRQGRGRERDPARPAAVHGRRRHDAGRSAAGAAAGPVRVHGPPRLLRDRRARAGAAALRRSARRPARSTRRPPRSPRGRAARRASRTACCVGSGTGRRSAATGRSAWPPHGPRSRCTRWTSSGSTGSTVPCSRPCARGSAGDRSG